jgi:precorrin-2 dehydrogenase/sirohydrochlorin ferrochelatase
MENTLFPVFMKLDSLNTLVVGGGNVGLEKLGALLRNSPLARVTLVAGTIRSEVKELAMQHSTVKLVERDFQLSDLENKHLVILATDDAALHRMVYSQAQARNLLVNVADTPTLCDFYLGSVVSKGHLKIGISTNGKSPTMAKRFREFLDSSIPEDVHGLLDNMHAVRSRIKGDFQEKIKRLNEITSSWLTSREDKHPEAAEMLDSTKRAAQKAIEFVTSPD